jgi:hypothetical protein
MLVLNMPIIKNFKYMTKFMILIPIINDKNLIALKSLRTNCLGQ